MIFVLTAFAYVVAFAVTTFAIAPLQALFFPEITIFASLVYLPHGIRVLETWALGWRSIPTLALANFVAATLFMPDSALTYLGPRHVLGALVGASSAFIAFEVLRAAGINLYFGQTRSLNWKGIVAIGVLASVFNAIGNSIVYGELISISDKLPILLVYLLGDVIGLIVCLFVLMLGFRWHRRRESELTQAGKR